MSKAPTPIRSFTDLTLNQREAELVLEALGLLSLSLQKEAILLQGTSFVEKTELYLAEVNDLLTDVESKSSL